MIFGFMILSTPVFASWTCTKNGESTVNNFDTLAVPLYCTDGKAETYHDLQVFRPKDKSEIQVAMNNWAATEKSKTEANEIIIKTVKPGVDSDNTMSGNA